MSPAMSIDIQNGTAAPAPARGPVTSASYSITVRLSADGDPSSIGRIATAVGSAGGAVVLTSSYAGKKMQPFMIHYTTSKHAVTGMTRAFAAELGKHHIRVNSVHPGAVATPMGSGDMVSAIERTNASNPKLALMGTAFLDQPWMPAEEIASAVAFLVSDDATFITAEHLSIDAGAQWF